MSEFKRTFLIHPRFYKMLFINVPFSHFRDTTFSLSKMFRTSSIPRWMMLLQISFCLVLICHSNSLEFDQKMPLLPPQNVHNLVGKRDSGERIGNELEGEPQEKRSAVRMSDKVVRQIIHTPNAPQAIGPYSQAVRIGNRLLLSGSLGIDPATGQFPDGGITEQTHQSLKNIGEVLKAAGVGYENVVQVQVLLADINDFAKMNDVYKEYFKSNFPARAAYQAAALPRGGLVEIVCEAVAGEISNL